MLPRLASAHAGPHHPAGDGPLHALTAPDHALALFGVVGVVCVVAWAKRIRKGRLTKHRHVRE